MKCTIRTQSPHPNPIQEHHAQKHCRVVLKLCLFLLLSILGMDVAFAQAQGSIRGVISDPSGAPISGAKVTIRHQQSGRSQEVTTGANGSYQFDGLAVGTYQLRVEAAEFQPAEQQVRVEPQGVAMADFRLQIEAAEEQIQVSAAARYERSLGGLPLSASVIQREEALKFPGRSIDSLLRNVASVQLQLYDADIVFPIIPSIAMRGIGVGDTATRALVLVDGLPINGGFFGNVFWNRAPPDTIEQIEVVRGASSSLFGSFAMGGAVDVITHVPERRELAIEARYGENDRLQGTLNYGDVVLGGSTAFHFNVTHYETEGYFLVPEEGRSPIDEREAAEMTNVQGRVTARFTDKAQGFVRLGYNDQERDGGYPLQQTDMGVADLAGGVDLDLQDVGLLNFRGFYGHEDLKIDNVRLVDNISTFVSNRHDVDSDDYGLSGQWTKLSSGFLSSVSGGVDFRRIDGQNHQDVFNMPDVLAATIVGGGIQTSVGVFGQASLRPTDSFEILANLRVDHFRDTDGQIITGGTAETFPERTLTVASPRVALRYQFSEPVALRAVYYEGFRAPTLAERYRSFESPTFRGLSNPDLNEEHLRGGDVGAEVRGGGFRGEVNWFYNRLEDFVGSAEVGFVDDKFTVMNTNVAEIRSQGAEVIGEMRLSRQFRLAANYTFTDATVIEGPLQGNAVEGAPRHVTTFTLNYFSPFGLDLDFRGRWVDESFQDITGEAPQDEHVVFGLSAWYRLHRNVSLFVIGENLFDEKYIADGFGQILGAPRQIWGGLRFTF
jgi:outer membrane receptor protein involved in Fe transport